MYGGLNQDPTERDPITGEENVNVAGRTGALPSTSGPVSAPPSGGMSAPLSQPTEQPAQAGPDSQQAGSNVPDMVGSRGNPADLVHNGMRNDAEGITAAAEQSAEAIQNVRANDNTNSAAQAQIINNELREMGGLPSVEQVQEEFSRELQAARDADKITPKQHTELKKRWRNIFNIISEDEMGLFLIDFGLRAMMAGETMGSAGAIGAAGAGALGALQERRQLAEQNRVADVEAVRQAGLDEREMRAKEMTAEAALTRANAMGQGYQGEKAWLLDLGRSIGRTDEEMFRMFEGAQSYDERFTYWMDYIGDVVASAKEDPNLLPGGNADQSGKKFQEYTEQDMLDFAQRMARGESSTLALQRALTGSQGE